MSPIFQTWNISKVGNPIPIIKISLSYIFLKKILTLKKKKKPDELNPENPEHTVVVLRNIRHLACRTFVPETGGLRCLVDNFVHLQIKVYYQHFRNVRNTKHTQHNYMFIGMNQSV